MEDYDDIRDALKLDPNGDLGWQVTQTRLAASLISARLQSLDRRVCAVEEGQSPKEEGDPEAWKAKAVTVIVWGALALAGSMLADFVLHVIESKLHIG